MFHVTFYRFAPQLCALSSWIRRKETKHHSRVTGNANVSVKFCVRFALEVLKVSNFSVQPTHLDDFPEPVQGAQQVRPGVRGAQAEHVRLGYVERVVVRLEPLRNLLLYLLPRCENKGAGQRHRNCAKWYSARGGVYDDNDKQELQTTASEGCSTVQSCGQKRGRSHGHETI